MCPFPWFLPLLAPFPDRVPAPPGTGKGVREAVAASVAVVVCSRCLEGRVEPVYGRGGGRDLADAGALFAGDLAGPKVRVLLQVALGSEIDAASALEAA